MWILPLSVLVEDASAWVPGALDVKLVVEAQGIFTVDDKVALHSDKPFMSL